MSEESVATEGLHSHYCNICEGDWDHDGACQEGAVACCPWCFAMANAAPVPGGRRGPHFHFCPDCTQNWQHQAACSAPLRVVLPDCTGCREQTGGRSIGRPSRPHGARLDFIRGARLVRKIAGPAAIAAGVIVAVPLLILASSLFWSRQPRSVARVPEPHVVVTPPAPQPQTPQPETPPPAAQAPAEPLPSAA